MLKAWRVTGLLFPALLFTVHVSVASAATSLVQAARAGDLGAVRALLDKGSDANEAEVDGTTALHWAARRGDLQIVLALLRAGADAGARNRYGVAPLLL